MKWIMLILVLLAVGCTPVYQCKHTVTATVDPDVDKFLYVAYMDDVKDMRITVNGNTAVFESTTHINMSSITFTKYAQTGAYITTLMVFDNNTHIIIYPYSNESYKVQLPDLQYLINCTI